MSDVLFEADAPVTDRSEVSLRPGLYAEAKIVGCFHARILSRPVGHRSPGTKVLAVFHRRATDGSWSVDILEDGPSESEHVGLLKRSPWLDDRDAANRWLRYRSRSA